MWAWSALSIEIKTDVKDAGVYVNNKLVGKTPLKEPLKLDLGHYIVEVKKKGYTDFSDEFDLPGGEKMVLEPKLEKIGGAEPEPVEEEEVKEEPVPAAEEKKEKKAGRKKLKPAAFYAMVGVTGALAIGVIATGVLTMQTHQDYEDTLESDWKDRNDLIDKGNTLGIATDALIGVGAAAALTAVILAVFTDFGKKEKKKKTAESSLTAPDLKLGAGSVMFEQRF